MRDIPLHDERPWGSFDQFTENEETTVKIIRVHPSHRLSLQKHAKRAEYWYVISGSGAAEVDATTYPLSPGISVHIPIGGVHRLTAGEAGIEILEIATGKFDEHDIERLEDDYGRTPATD